MMRCLALLPLVLSGCIGMFDDPPPGTLLDEDHPWLDEVQCLPWDWEMRDDLPTIFRAQCARWIRTVEVRTATEQEWIHELRACPCVDSPSGMSEDPACEHATGCVHGMVTLFGSTRDSYPVIFLSPRESADGHGLTVRHEMAHLMARCSELGADSNHTIVEVWGMGGVVWTPTTACGVGL